MIAPNVIVEIQRLLELGELSQRKIASKLGVSRGTVNSVANGTRVVREVRRIMRRERFDPPHGPPRRCPSCGRLVQMPCLACSLQKLANKIKNTRHDFKRRP